MKTGTQVVIGIAVATAGLLALALVVGVLTQPAEAVKSDAAIAGDSSRIAPGVVRREDFGMKWPFVPDAVELRCHKTYIATVVLGGREYGLNGTARGQGYADPPASFRRTTPLSGDGYVPVGVLIKPALALCKSPS